MGARELSRQKRRPRRLADRIGGNALAKENYKQVIDYLQTPYDVLPTLRSGTLLLRAYQGLGNNEKVEALLADLQQRFSFGQHNINDSIQLY